MVEQYKKCMHAVRFVQGSVLLPTYPEHQITLTTSEDASEAEVCTF